MLCQPGAGAPLTLGRSSAPLARLAPACLPPAAPIADLGAELFGHLAGLPMDGKGAEAVPLAHVTLVTLGSGGGSGDGGSSSAAGCVLGLRVSHLVGDYGTLRGLLHHLARAYSGRALAAADVPAPGAPLVAALAAAPPPPGARQHNYLPAPPELGGQLAALAAAPSLQGLVLHVPPARLAQLKAQAAAEAAAAAAVDGSAGGAAAVLATSAGGAAGAAGQKFVSTNDALMAWLWRTLAALPCRGGRVVAFNQVGPALPPCSVACCCCCRRRRRRRSCCALAITSLAHSLTALLHHPAELPCTRRAWTCGAACRWRPWRRVTREAPRLAGCPATLPPAPSRLPWTRPRCRWGRWRSRCGRRSTGAGGAPWG